jgi:PAS domain S-box-containing protein
VLAAALGYLGADWFFTEPPGAVLRTPAEVIGLGVYLLSCSFITLLGVSLRAARQRAAAHARQLEAEVAERRRAEAALRQSENQFRRIVETANEGIWILDAEARVALVNERMADLLGYRPEEMRGRFKWEFVFPEDEPFVRKLFLRRRAGIREQADVRFRRKDGRPVWTLLAAQPLFDPGGRFQGALDMFSDLTDRKHAEDALRESEARLRLLADTTPSAVWTAAPDGSITYASERWYRYTGLTPEANARDWPDRVLHPDDRARCLAQWTRALAGGTEYTVEVRIRRHDGAYRWFLTRAVPVRDADGRVTAWFGSSTDIHEQKQLEEALREADRRKDQFLAMLAHELRNPLGPIRNAVRLLQSAGPADPVAEQARGMIDRQAAHMARLVDDLLDVSRISRGKILLREEPCDLARVVREVAGDFRASLEGSGLRLTVAVADRPVWVQGDRTRLAQVVGNMVHNAHKFSDVGGRVSVCLAVEGEDRAVVAVRDTGIGMTPEVLAHVFEAFSQADQSLDRSRGGLGLGMALARGLVELHGGSIAATSDGPGRGSEFTVRLPLIPAPAPPPDGDAPDARDGRTLRVLVVEDNPDGARSLGMLLRLSGHEAALAHNGPAGLETARAFRPEVVLCDIGLPGMDGYAVAKAMRRDPDLAGVYLIALTGYGQEEDRRRAQEAGFDLHLTKPVDFPQLEQMLASLSAPRSPVSTSGSAPSKTGGG